ncbi:unnamed protein product [Phytophthora lilii]|uniref:Unnamed protein product n=1 Tax=Phytophthora lilii TaxID=2077276 RepID=A0A9W6WNZ5_9STRA|nr:unnamed protein product [Phytophthora lilii]
MTLDPSRKAPRRLPLLLDIVLVVATLLLDARDLWFKLRWVGPGDAFAFSTVEKRVLPASDAAPLQPTTRFSYDGQKLQRESGWSSFLQKCESLIPVAEDDEARGFRYAIGKNCLVGASSSTIQASELFLTSSISVDSMAWTACELLYKHRKPPICHSPIVTRFREHYGFQSEIALSESSVVEPTNDGPGNMDDMESYAATPGSEAETELIELLEVVSKSSPISSVVCIEGFILKGSGRYSATIYGCGSPSFYQSSFVGIDTPRFAQLQRDKGWLVSHSIRIMGMRFLLRENRRSIVTTHEARTFSGAEMELGYSSLLNYSSSGTLYILMVNVDFALLVLNVCSLIEIARFMLWPLWKPLIASEYQTSIAQTTKMGFETEDYAQVLQVGLLRSTSAACLTVTSRLLSWMLVVPSVVLWSDGKLSSGDVHAFLTIIRVCDLVVLCVNFFWDMIVAYDEQLALAFVREAFVSPLEITMITAIVAAVGCPLMVPQNFDFSCHHDRRCPLDYRSFENTTVFANACAGCHDSMIALPTTFFKLYYPLLVVVGLSTFIVCILVFLRFRARKRHVSRSLVQPRCRPMSVVQPKSSPVAVFRNIQCDLTSSSAGILMRSMSPPPSPTREGPTNPVLPCSSPSTEAPPEISNERLPIEKVIDNPIRAGSLVRRSWALEKLADGQLLLLPSSYLKYGIVLVGRSMKTRCGFMDIVQPLVHVQEHKKLTEAENEPQEVAGRNATPNLR